MSRVRIGLMAGGMALLILVGNAEAQTAPSSEPQGSLGSEAVAVAVQASPIPDAQLDKYRGGFLVADGITLGFGALTKTVIDGQLALETQVTWGDTGVTVENTAGAAVVQGGALSPAVLGALSASGIHVADPGTSAYVTPDGGTAVILGVNPNGLTNSVLNTASNRSITQNTAITLTLPGFQSTQAQISQAMTASALALAAANAAVNALHH